VENLKQKTILGGFVKLIGQAANFVLRIAFMAVMARLLDPKDFGLVAMVTAVTGIYDLFTTAGLSVATVQKASVTDDQVSTLFWINVLIGAILALLCMFSAPMIAAFYNEPRLIWISVAMGAGFLCNAAGVQHFALLQRQLRYVVLAALDIVSQIASFAVGIALALSGFGYWSLVAATLTVPIVTTFGVWIASAWMPGPPRRNCGILPMLSFGTTITFNGLVVYVAYNLDKVLLGRFWGPDVLGVYGRAYQLINVPTANVYAAASSVMFPTLSRLQHDPARLKNYFLKGYSLVVSITMPATIFCALFADDIILVILGSRWADAATIFRLLAPTILVFGIINPAAWLLLSTGLQMRSLKVALAVAAVVVTAYVAGLPYGANGVAFAFSAAMVLWMVPHIYWCLHKTIVSPRDLLLAAYRPFVASVVAAAGVYVLHLAFAQWQASLLRLLIGGAMTGGLYLWLLLFVMGQKEFYLDVVKGLKPSAQPA
jgi:O-antigen/teichoic acid export membrane protein